MLFCVCILTGFHRLHGCFLLAGKIKRQETWSVFSSQKASPTHTKSIPTTVTRCSPAQSSPITSLLKYYRAQALKYLSIVFKQNPLKPLNPQQILPQHYKQNPRIKSALQWRLSSWSLAFLPSLLFLLQDGWRALSRHWNFSQEHCMDFVEGQQVLAVLTQDRQIRHERDKETFLSKRFYSAPALGTVWASWFYEVFLQHHHFTSEPWPSSFSVFSCVSLGRSRYL